MVPQEDVRGGSLNEYTAAGSPPGGFLFAPGSGDLSHQCCELLKETLTLKSAWEESSCPQMSGDMEQTKPSSGTAQLRGCYKSRWKQRNVRRGHLRALLLETSINKEANNVCQAAQQTN